MAKKTAKKSVKKKAATQKAAKAKSAAKPAKKTAKKPVKKQKVSKKVAKKAATVKTAKTAKSSTTAKRVKPAAKTTKVAKAAKAPKAAKVTKAAKSTKKSAPRVAPQPVVRVNHKGFTLPEDLPTIEQLRKVKTGLKKKDLMHYRQLLLEKRAEMLGDVEAMDRVRNDSGGDISHMPLHMADVGSDNYEQEATLGLMEFERKILREIDEALVRMIDGCYGVCMMTGEPIKRERLDAKPWAKYTIEVVRELEKRGRY